MRSTITIKQILADSRMLVQGAGFNYSDPTDAAMLTRYNFALPKIYKALNGAKSARFSSAAPVGSPPSYIAAVAGDNKTYTASTKKITAGTIGATFIGAIVMFSDGTNRYFSYVTAVTVNTDFTVADGPASDIASGILRYIILRSPIAGTTSYSLDGYRVDEIRRVHGVLAGNAARVSEDTYEGLASNPYYDNSIAIVQTGTGGNPTISRYAGSGTTTGGGYLILFFDEKPRVATATTENVDLPEEYHGPLIEEIARMTLVEVGGTVPKELENPLQTLSVFTDTFQMMKEAYLGNLDKVA